MELRSLEFGNNNDLRLGLMNHCFSDKNAEENDNDHPLGELPTRTSFYSNRSAHSYPPLPSPFLILIYYNDYRLGEPDYNCPNYHLCEFCVYCTQQDPAEH